MKLWQAITLIIFTFVFFWLLACYGASAKVKRCQTCCPIPPSATYLHNDLANAYEITIPINEEIRKLKMTITENQVGNEVVKYNLEDVKSGKIAEGIEGLLYYRTFQVTLFTIIDDPKYPDSPIVRTLDCVFDPTITDSPQAKGDCVFIGAKGNGVPGYSGNILTVPSYENIPVIFDRR